MNFTELKTVKEGSSAEIYSKEDIVYKIGDISRRDILSGQYELLREINDPHFVKVYDWIEEDGKCGYSMELISGDTLEDLFSRPPDSEEEFERVRNILLDILDGLEALHSKDIIHGDLKPSHIFVSGGERIRFIDPGYDPDIITPRYSSPESIMGNASKASDIYSIGMILYEVISGEKPYSCPLNEIIRKKFEERLESPKVFNIHIPESFNVLIERMISKKPESRFRSVNEVRAEMDISMPSTEIKPSLIQIFTDRMEEISVFEEAVENLPEFHVINFCGKSGMGKTFLLRQLKMRGLSLGINVEEMRFEEFYSFITEGKYYQDKKVIIIDDVLKPHDFLDVIEKHEESIGFSPILILAGMEEQVKTPEKIRSSVTTLEIEPLGKEEITEICQKNFPGMDNIERLASFLKERSGGIPGGIYKILNILIDNGAIERKTSRFDFNSERAESLGIPEKLENLIAEQVEKLPENEIRLLKKISIFPRKIPGLYLENLSIENYQLTVESLLSRNILERKEGSLKFSSRWIQKYLHDHLSAEEKEHLLELLHRIDCRKPEVLASLQIELGYKKEAFQSLKEAAKENIKKKDYPDAISFIERALTLEEDSNLKLVLVRLYELTSRDHEALKIHKELLKEGRNEFYHLLKIGYNQRLLEELEESEKNLLRVVENAEGEIRERAVYELGYFYMQNQGIEKAESFLKGFPGLKSVRIQYLRAMIALKLNNFERAFEISEKTLEKPMQPTYRSAFSGIIGNVELKRENFNDALKYFNRAIEQSRETGNRYNYAVYLNGKGRVLLRMAKYREAIGCFQEALKMQRAAGREKSIQYVLMNLSVIYLIKGYWDKMENEIKELEEKYGSIDPTLREKVVYSSIYRGNFKRAAGIIRELEDRDFDAREARGILCAFKKEQKNAEEIFRELHEEVKSQPRKRREIAIRLSEAIYSQGREEEATRILMDEVEKIDEISSKFLKGKLLSSWGYISGDREKIKEAISLFVEINLPFFTARAQLKLGEVFLDEDRPAKAVEILREAEETFEKLGAKPFLDKTRELLSECAKKLTGRSGYIRTYNEITDLLSTIDSEKRFDETLKTLVNFFNAERGALILKEEGKSIIASSYNIDRKTLEDAEEISRTITGRSAEGEVILSGDARSDNRFSDLESVNRNQIRSILCVPVTSKDKIYGVLYLDSTLDKNIFLPGDRKFLQSLGRILGLLFVKGDMLYELREENVRLKKITDTPHSFHSIIGISEKMQGIFRTIEESAPLDVNILITGETGTGKELVARTIHNLSPRKNKPFLTVDCGSLSKELLKSELFGHKKGSFTGAVEDKIGMCEKASGGTLFLDEIGDAPPSVQAGLLHVADRGEIRRVGESEWRKVDVRILSATNRNLEQAIAIKEFREDLYYRLNHITINLPPLRERRDDIPLIAKHYLKIFAEKIERSIDGFSRKTLIKMKEYDWPGNVRELKHTVEVALLKSNGRYISTGDLPRKFHEKEQIIPGKWDDAEDEVKKKAILNALDRADGNKALAARRLNISRRHLYRLIEDYNIEV